MLRDIITVEIKDNSTPFEEHVCRAISDALPLLERRLTFDDVGEHHLRMLVNKSLDRFLRLQPSAFFGRPIAPGRPTHCRVSTIDGTTVWEGPLAESEEAAWRYAITDETDALDNIALDRWRGLFR